MLSRRQWETSNDPLALLLGLHRRLTIRKAEPGWVRRITLYSAALCRQHWAELPWLCRILTEIAEQCADGEPVNPPLPYPFRDYSVAVKRTATTCFIAAEEAKREFLYPAAELVRWEDEFLRLGYKKPTGADDHLSGLLASRFFLLAHLVDSLTWEAPSQWESPSFPPNEFHSLPLLRDIGGNPFRPIEFKPEWRTDTVMTLAR
jgi:hypothetical protein